jgi:polynucleotide 5'-kinase involved in rRNA processing
LVGAARLVEAANELGVDVIIYDTSGLVDPGQGGTALKLAKIDLLRPEAVFAIQAGDELESLLIPLRRSRRSRVVDLSASPDARRRDVPTRQAYRADQFANYFRNARLLSINWANLPIFPAPRFAIDCLVSCDDAEGFVRELGVVQEIDRKMHMIRLLTPLISIDGVASIRLGDLTLDRSNFRDYRR